MLTIQIDLAGDAFQIDPGKCTVASVAEISRVLRSIVGKLDDGFTGGASHDSNGNICGSWCLRIERE